MCAAVRTYVRMYVRKPACVSLRCVAMRYVPALRGQRHRRDAPGPPRVRDKATHTTSTLVASLKRTERWKA